jgi:hypothetical protein
MQFDPEIVKRHPYGTGIIVIVGGLIVFWLLSRKGGGVATSSGTSFDPSADYAAALQAQTQQSSTAAAAGVQNYQTAAALQAAQIQAQTTSQQVAAAQETTDYSTTASLLAQLAQYSAASTINTSNNQATTTQQTNELAYAQNIQQLQDSVLENEIGAGVAENANNNATAVAGESIQANVADTSLTDQTLLSTQQQTLLAANQNQVNTIISNLVYAPGGPPSSGQVEAASLLVPYGSPLGTTVASSTAAQNIAASTASSQDIIAGIKGGTSLALAGLALA